MALDFPNSPTAGQQFTGQNGVTYNWDGVKWSVAGGGGGGGGGGQVTPPIVLTSTIQPTGSAYVELLAAGGSLEAPVALQAGEGIGGFYGGGYNGVAFSDGGQLAIDFYAAGNWTPSSTPTSITFGTTPVGATHAAPAIGIDEAQNTHIIGTLTVGNIAGETPWVISQKAPVGTGGADLYISRDGLDIMEFWAIPSGTGIEINGTIYVTQHATFAQNVDVTGGLAVSGVVPGSTLPKTFEVSGDSYLNGNVNILNGLQIEGVVAGTTDTLYVNGSQMITNGLTVEAVVPGSTQALVVIGDSYLNGKVDVRNGLTIEGVVAGTTDTLYVNGSQVTTGGLNASGGLNVSGIYPGSTDTLVVTGNSYLNGNVDVRNGLQIEGLIAGTPDTLYVTGNVNVTGNVTAANFPSEARFKNNIEDYSQGLEAIVRLRPVSWEWNELSGITDRHRPIQYGVLADEAEAALPQAIGTRQMKGEAVKTLDDRPVLYALVNAVKELAVEVAELKGART